MGDSGFALLSDVLQRANGGSDVCAPLPSLPVAMEQPRLSVADPVQSPEPPKPKSFFDILAMGENAYSKPRQPPTQPPTQPTQIFHINQQPQQPQQQQPQQQQPQQQQQQQQQPLRHIKLPTHQPTHHQPPPQFEQIQHNLENQRVKVKPPTTSATFSHSVQQPKPYQQLPSQDTSLSTNTNVYTSRGVYEGTNEVGIGSHDQASTFATEPVAVHLTVDGREMPLTTSLRTVGIGGLV